MNKNVRETGSDELGVPATHYHDIPKQCVWGRSTKVWKTRSRVAACKVIGRLANMTPTEGERFYFFLLLLAQPGACGFENLRTVEDELLPTFQAAATMRGLYDSDEDYHVASRDVLAVATVVRARRFLAMILICCEVADPLLLAGYICARIPGRLPYPEPRRCSRTARLVQVLCVRCHGWPERAAARQKDARHFAAGLSSWVWLGHPGHTGVTRRGCPGSFSEGGPESAPRQGGFSC